MMQYNKIKNQHPDALLLFRVGDFYETFGNDAIKASKILDIVLTNRSNGSSKIELAGFPYHSIDTYLPKLVRAGERVAICDQLEDPKTTKKIVKRGVTELVTPGVSYRDTHFDNNSNNFLSSIYYSKNYIGIAFLDNSTGEFLIAEGEKEYIDKLLQSFAPSEILYEKNKKKIFIEEFGKRYHSYPLEDWIFNIDYANELLLNQFKTNSLKGFGITEFSEGIIAAGVILHYLKETHHNHNTHITKINRIEKEKYVWMDRFTIRNLELFHSANEEALTLINILDNTLTSMGSRMIKRWLALPLKEKNEIEERNGIVESIINDKQLERCFKESISKIGDLERLISKVTNNKINPRECKQLQISLESIHPIKIACKSSKNNNLKNISESINDFNKIIKIIKNSITEKPPVLINKGNVIKEGVNKELDKIRGLLKNGKEYLDKILERETKNTSIPSLKISFNNVFGYFLEVRNIHKEKVPNEWIRKQTLVNAERYITEELKEYEHKILTAQEKILELENKIYNELIHEISKYVEVIQANSKIIAKLDCLYSLSSISNKYDYTKPLINNGDSIIIKGGRHPVIERKLNDGEKYIPNDMFLDRKSQQIMMITGPNMSGKSAILRQTALIVLMAQIGCFVPAVSSEIGIVDKIFTRVGASDNISMGESTFMMEMNETASILNNLSERSLILLDEIGRGTSTYDGISIAWSIAEYLHEHNSKAKTLFATHYHELNEMSKSFERIKNYNVSVKEFNNKIIFIRTLKEGGSEHSFGIHVAKMSGMPNEIIEKSNEVLKKLESNRSKQENTKKINSKDQTQLSFFKMEDPQLIEISNHLEKIDINSLTPVEALIKINELKKLLGK